MKKRSGVHMWKQWKGTKGNCKVAVAIAINYIHT